MSHVPGIPDTQLRITPSCRSRREGEVISDTVMRVERSLKALLNRYDSDDPEEIRVAVTVVPEEDQ